LNYCSIVFGSCTKSAGSDDISLRKNGRSSSFLFYEISVLGIII
jgi:hypothetical protein